MNTWLTYLVNVRSDATYALRRLTQIETHIGCGNSLSGACRRGLRRRFPADRGIASKTLPIGSPERLFVVDFRSPNIDESRIFTYDSNSYPSFERMKRAVQDQAKLTAVSYTDRSDLTYNSDDETERAFKQLSRETCSPSWA